MPVLVWPKSRSSSSQNIIPLSANDSIVSLTGYTNILLDDSKPDSNQDEENNKIRVKYIEVPSIGLNALGVNVSKKRKYWEPLQILKPFRPSSKDGKLPVNNAGFISFVFMTWFSPLVWKMFRNRTKPVDESDIWECTETEGVQENTNRVIRLWKDEIKKYGEKNASFFRVWVKFVRTRAMVAFLGIILNSLSTFASSALLVNKILAYLESSETNIGYGLGLTAAIIACEIVRAVSFANIMTIGAQTGTRFRSGYMGIMYDKLLKIKTLKGKTNSEIINIFSVDSYRVYMVSWNITFLLSLPVYLIISTSYCYSLIGYWCFVSIGSFIVCYIAQTSLTTLLKILRTIYIKFTDMRVRRMGEVLTSMKFIKMYAWEKPFSDAIKTLRKSEQKYLMYSALVQSITSSIIPITPTIASVITITVYTAAGNNLNASTVK